MTMTETEKNEFVNSYTKALVTSWSSEEYTGRLMENPQLGLREVGLEVPATARVEIVRSIPEETDPSSTGGHLDRQIALWQVGLDTGYYQLYLPDTPQVDTESLDLDELSDVAGGTSCCCCPCSCCT